MMALGSGIARPGECPADPAVLGGKGAALAALQAAGFPVPPWFAVPPDAEPDTDGLVAAAEDIAGAGGRLAVRSSAVEEDGADHSFAGQLESFLDAPPADVPARVAAVRASGMSERVAAYRRERGLPGEPSPPAVLVQRMVCADAAGVAFSADPVTGRRGVAVVAAVKGSGERLVSGEADAATWRVDRAGVVVERPHDPEAALPDAQVAAIAALARRAARHFGRPQDIEWALEGATLYLLQSRPITSLAALPDPDAALAIWDNSNIAESYSGITTPLTFSFARRAYEEVYRQLCRLLGVPETAIEEHDSTFRNMLGLVRGRVYYNLLNWYRLLALLPGFTSNRKFMEQMMGVREELPGEIVAGLRATTARDRRADRRRLYRTALGLIGEYRRLPRGIEAFYARLDEALRPPAVPLAEMRADELVAAYRELERRLLTHWDAPLVNDFFAMVFYGALRKLATSWCGDAEGTLQNDLVRATGGMVSAQPAALVREMAAIAAREPGLPQSLLDGGATAVGRSPELAAALERYLDRFGDRCMEELKLESATLYEDPTPLYRSIGALALHGEMARGPVAPDGAAEARAFAALRGSPLRRAVFRWVLANARGRVRDRENLRLERTRLFGRVRRIFVELGRRLHADGVLDDPRDVFYLQVEEALGFVEGAAAGADLRGVAAVRKAEFARYRELPAPPERFETRGAPYVAQSLQAPAPPVAADPSARQGLGCCPGVVRGAVRVVTDPRDARLEPSCILVAERTDPGWVMLFPAASGLLVERGSLLSHSAIVARELGLPAIVSIPGLLAWLRDGDCVEMDGATGRVRRIGQGEGASDAG